MAAGPALAGAAKAAPKILNAASAVSGMAPASAQQGKSSKPPGISPPTSRPIKVPFQSLFEHEYTDIKKCFCEGVANLFSESLMKCTTSVHESVKKNIYVEVVSTENIANTKQINTDFESNIGAHIDDIMVFILTNPDPQIKIDIRKNLAGGCQPQKNQI